MAALMSSSPLLMGPFLALRGSASCFPKHEDEKEFLLKKKKKRKENESFAVVFFVHFVCSSFWLFMFLFFTLSTSCTNRDLHVSSLAVL